MKNLEELTLSELIDVRNELGIAISESEHNARHSNTKKNIDHFKALAKTYRRAFIAVKLMIREKLNETIGLQVEKGGEDE